MPRKRRLIRHTNKLAEVASLEQLRAHFLTHMLLGDDPATDSNGQRITLGLLIHQWYSSVIPTWGVMHSDGELLASIRHWRSVYPTRDPGACSLELWRRDASLVLGGLNNARKAETLDPAMGGELIAHVMEGMNDE